MRIGIIKNILFFIFPLLLVSCNCNDNNLSPVRKDIEPKTLVAKLRKDNLFYSFNGYGVTPRDERSGIYLITRGKEFLVYHWVQYNPNGTKFLKFYNSYINKDSVEIKLSILDSLVILKKAHELIGILKKCELRGAGCEFGKFDCSFNDSSRMTYVKDKSELDSNFYRFHKNLNWVDSNFVTYY